MDKPQKAKTNSKKTMAISSINFQKMSVGSFSHNDRSGKNPDYIIGSDDDQKNEFDNSAAAAEKLLKELRAAAATNYQNTVGQKMQTKKGNDTWEAVINLNREHTLEDVKKIADFIEKDTGFTSMQISVHKDEGHVNERGVKQYNNHAHINFFTLDKTTGKQLYHKSHRGDGKGNIISRAINAERLSYFQTEIAKKLNMQRGKIGSKARRLSAKQYRAVIQNKKPLKSQISSFENQLKSEYEQNREVMKASKRAKRHDYMSLKSEYEQQKNNLKHMRPVPVYDEATKTKKEHESEYMALFALQDVVKKSEFSLTEPLIHYRGQAYEFEKDKDGNIYISDDKNDIVYSTAGDAGGSINESLNQEINASKLRQKLDEDIKKKEDEKKKKLEDENQSNTPTQV